MERAGIMTTAEKIQENGKAPEVQTFTLDIELVELTQKHLDDYYEYLNEPKEETGATIRTMRVLRAHAVRSAVRAKWLADPAVSWSFGDKNGNLVLVSPESVDKATGDNIQALQAIGQYIVEVATEATHIDPFSF